MNSLAENDQAKQPSHGVSNGRKNSGPSVSTSMATVKRGICQLPSLDISLLPSWEPMGSFPYQHRGQLAASPQQYCPVPSPSNVNVFRSHMAGAVQPPCSQLTIFYAGKVNLYNVSADQSKAIMAVAGRFSGFSGSGTPSFSTSMPSTPLNSVPRCMAMTPITPCPSPVAILSHTLSAQTIKSEALPISQKNSILRFLEKRNDRIHHKGPYPRPAEK